MTNLQNHRKKQLLFTHSSACQRTSIRIVKDPSPRTLPPKVPPLSPLSIKYAKSGYSRYLRQERSTLSVPSLVLLFISTMFSPSPTRMMATFRALHFPMPHCSKRFKIPSTPGNMLLRPIRALTRAGKHISIKKSGGVVRRTEMDHPGIPFHQVFVPHTHYLRALGTEIGLVLARS